MKQPLPAADAEERVRASIAILDAMFDDPELRRLRRKERHHPAVLRRDALAALFPSRSRSYEELVFIFAELAAMEFDRFWLPAASAIDFWSVIPDRAAAERVRQNILDPKKFNETLAEVRTWDHLRRNGNLAADLLEEEARPDIVVDRGAADETWIEVKFVHVRTGLGGVMDAVKTANRQLRLASSEGAGVLYVFLERVFIPRRLPKPSEQSSDQGSGADAPPVDVRPIIERIEGALRGTQYKSVAAAVVAWDEFRFVGDWPDTVIAAAGRHSKVLRHANPRTCVPWNDSAIQIGAEAVARFTPSGPVDPG